MLLAAGTRLGVFEIHATVKMDQRASVSSPPSGETSAAPADPGARVALEAETTGGERRGLESQLVPARRFPL